MMTRNLIVVSALGLAAALTAQQPIDKTQVAGLVFGTTDNVTVQEADGNCRRTKRCASTLGTSTNAQAGGTAYDPRVQGTWNSDGTRIELLALDNCTRLCAFNASLIVGTRRISGLAYNRTARRLWALESGGNTFGMAAYDVSRAPGTCGTRVSACSATFGLPGRASAGGLAFDQVRRLFYMGVTQNTSTGFVHWIFVMDERRPCTVLCRYRLPARACLTRLIQGVAYDSCKKTLFVTDSLQIQRLSVLNPLNCSYRQLPCCVAAGLYRGLAFVPSWSGRSKGTSCATGSCLPCNGLKAGARGVPAVGNSGFVWKLEQGPAGQLGVAVMRIGALTNPVPVFCGSIYVLPNHFMSAHVLSGSGCNGSASQAFPIPPVAAACGAVISSQWLVICRGSRGLGYALSNAAEVTIRP